MKSAWHEAMVNLAAHPALWCLAGIVRRLSPVCRVPGLGLVVSDPDFARIVLSRDDLFGKNGPGSFAQALTEALGPMALGNMDGEAHRQVRSNLKGVLSPERSRNLVRARRSELNQLHDRLAQREAVDLVHFVRGWAGRVAFEMVGVSPPQGQEDAAGRSIVELSARLSKLLGFQKASKARIERAIATREQLEEYFRDGYRTGGPPGSLVTALRDMGLNFDEARGLVLIYVIGGTLTVCTALPRLVAWLVDTGRLNTLTSVNRIESAIDEGLRLITPLPGTVRIANQDHVIKGRLVRAGTRIVILTCNLGLGKKCSEDPVRRFWYGAGAHRCVGLYLAQEELKAALGVLASVSGIRIRARRPDYGALLPGYRSLVIAADRIPM